MANPLLAEARTHVDAKLREKPPYDFVRAVDLMLRYLEERHEAARAPQVVPTASTLQCYNAPASDEERLRLQRELAGLAGQFKSFELDLERTRQGTTAPDALDLDALQALCDAATSGPWEYDGPRLAIFTPGRLGVCEFVDSDVEQAADDANGAFIAAARDALPKLIAEVRRLQAREQRLMPALQAFGIDSITARTVIRELERGEHV